MNETAVSFVIPVRNGARWLGDVLDAALVAIDGVTAEIIVVDDGSTDDTPAVLARFRREARVRILTGEQRGAAAAVNLGFRHARYEIVCQIDQDVVIDRGWLSHVLEPLADPDVAASQGWYVTPRDAGLWARVMGLDLDERYHGLRGRYLDHVCTGNTAYRASAVHAVALLDESLGYGYDNDLSYRLDAAGYRLAFARGARSVHHWREGLAAYVRQQYGLGYGRLDVISKHPRRVGGDDVSGSDMIAHAASMLAAVLSVAVALGAATVGLPAKVPAITAAVIVFVLAVERTTAGVRAAWRSRDVAGLWFAPVHLTRDLAWCAAIVVWTMRRLAARPRRPAHSM